MKCLMCSNALSNKIPGTSFHKFPWNPHYRLQWLRAIGYPNFDPSKFDVICSEHFTPDDIQLVTVTGRIILSKTAVPSRNLNPPACNSPPGNKKEQINSKESRQITDRDILKKFKSNKIRIIECSSHENSSTAGNVLPLSPDISDGGSTERAKNGTHPQFEQVMIVRDVVACVETHDSNTNTNASKTIPAAHTRNARGLKDKDRKCMNVNLKSNSHKDDQQVFGDYIASVLRSMDSEQKRKLLKTAIQLAIYKHTS